MPPTQTSLQPLTYMEEGENRLPQGSSDHHMLYTYTHSKYRHLLKGPYRQQNGKQVKTQGPREVVWAFKPSKEAEAEDSKELEAGFRAAGAAQKKSLSQKMKTNTTS